MRHKLDRSHRAPERDVGGVFVMVAKRSMKCLWLNLKGVRERGSNDEALVVAADGEARTLMVVHVETDTRTSDMISKVHTKTQVGLAGSGGLSGQACPGLKRVSIIEAKAPNRSPKVPAVADVDLTYTMRGRTQFTVAAR